MAKREKAAVKDAATAERLVAEVSKRNAELDIREAQVCALAHPFVLCAGAPFGAVCWRILSCCVGAHPFVPCSWARASAAWHVTQAQCHLCARVLALATGA